VKGAVLLRQLSLPERLYPNDMGELDNGLPGAEYNGLSARRGDGWNRRNPAASPLG
jgi:hypothetical protein